MIVGDEWPRPGMAVFQTTFLLSLQATGGVCPAAAIPFKFGPRQVGQSAASDLIVAITIQKSQAQAAV